MAKKNSSKTKKVILQILPSLESGGVERGTVDISKALVDNGYESIVISAGGKMAYQIDSKGGKHITLNVKTKNPIKIYKNIKKIKKIIKENNVSLVHVRSRAPAWSAYYAAKQTNTPLVTTFHGTYSITGKLKKKYNSIMVKGDRVIAISDFVKKHILENYPTEEKNIRVIHRGTDMDYFVAKKVNNYRLMDALKALNIPEDKQIIMLPGRFARWKGHEVLIRALTSLPKEDFFCLLVGDYQKRLPYKKELESLIKELKLEGSIRIVANISDMPAAYMCSNIVVSASSDQPEAFGRVSVEGQAMEKIVVATNHGGSTETVIDGKTGFLTPPGDSDKMAKALKKALELSDRKRKTIIKAARENVEKNFSLEQMIKKTLKVYKELL